MSGPPQRTWLAALLVVAAAPFVRPLMRGEVLVFRDHTDYFLPLRHFTATLLRSGHLPLWNPYNGSGEPWLANPQTGVFYPPSWLFLVLPFSTAYSLFLLFHLALLGAGAFYLFRRWASDESAFIAAAGLTLSGPALSFLDVNNNLATFAWYPLVVLTAMERSRAEPRFPRAAASCAIALMFLGGEPLLAFGGVLLWLACLFAWAERAVWREAAGVALLSVLLVSAQLLPFLEMLQGSDRSGGLAPGAAFGQSLALSDWLAAALSPVVLRRVKLFYGSQHFMPLLYLGLPVIAAALAGAAAAFRRATVRRVAALWLAVAVAAGLFAATGTVPPLARVMTAAHATFFRYPARAAAVVAFAVAALAAIGLDELQKATLRARLSAIGTALVAAGGAWLLLTSRRGGIDGRGFTEQLTIFVVAAVVVAAPQVIATRRGALLFGAAVAADLFLAAAPLLASGPLPEVPAPYDRLLSPYRKFVRLDDQSIRWRLSDRTRLMTGYLNLLGPHFDVSTAAPVVSARYLELEALVRSGRRRDLLDFLSVGYLISSRALAAPGLRLLFSAPGAWIYANGSSLPMVSVWGTARVADNSGAFDLLRRGGFDARHEILLDRPAAPDAVRGFPNAKLRYEIRPGRIALDVDATAPAVVVVNQRAARGWKVTVDGGPARGLLVNGMFLGVAVPPGAHAVEWLYRPPSVVAGMILTMAGIICSVLDATRFRRRRVKKKIST